MLPILRESSTPTTAPGTIDRRSATYIRWVQQSLNQVDKAGLVVDGIIGPKTRDAIRRFQTRAGVAADGVVGPVTEAALIKAGAGQPPRTTSPGTAGSGSTAVTAQFVPGPGLYSYKPASQQWGTPETIQALQAIGAAWQRSQPNGPRIGIGDISLRGGGPMRGHASHQHGLDIDIRPVRNDGREEPTNYKSSSYSRTLTQQLVDLIRSNGVLRVQYIFFNDPQVRGVSTWPNHDDHLHVRFYPPGVQREVDLEHEWLQEIDRRSPAYMRWVQQSLNQVDNAGLVVDGIKGPRTTAAVQRFQQRSGLVPDGIVGPKTEAALIAAGAPRPDALPDPPIPPAPPQPQPPVTPPQPQRPTALVCDSEGRRLLTGGVWNGNTTITVQGGQAMHFVLRNLNVLGTTITIRDHLGQSQSRIIPPLGTADMLFTVFGCEPMGWRFTISTNSDAFLVGWQVCSTWIPGDPRNC